MKALWLAVSCMLKLVDGRVVPTAGHEYKEINAQYSYVHFGPVLGSRKQDMNLCRYEQVDTLQQDYEDSIPDKFPVRLRPPNRR